jgi:predicted metal-binding protein
LHPPANAKYETIRTKGKSMTTWITICDTCKRDENSASADRTPDGEKLAALIEQIAPDPMKTRRHSCLMGCDRACNITIQAAGKISYSLGNFGPTAAAARAIVDYALLHQNSALGQVPYREWPQDIKGHFVSRHPPLPEGLPE